MWPDGWATGMWPRSSAATRPLFRQAGRWRSSPQTSSLAYMEPPLIQPVPKPKSLRWGTTLNLILPGAGLFYLGRRKLGAILAFAFLFCLVAALGIFLLGYGRYLNVVMGNGLLQDGQLEQLEDVFHKRWLVALVLVG